MVMLQLVSELAVPTPELSLMMSLVSPRLLSATPSASTEGNVTCYIILNLRGDCLVDSRPLNGWMIDGVMLMYLYFVWL